MNEWISALFMGEIVHRENLYVLRKYVYSPFSFILSLKEGDIIYNCLYPPGHVGKITAMIPQIMGFLLRIFAMSVFLISLNPKMFALGLVLIVILVGGSFFLSSTIGYRAQSIGVENTKNFIQVINLIFGGLKEIHIKGVTPFWLAKHKIYSLISKKVRVTIYLIERGPNIIVESILYIGIGALLLIMSSKGQQA